MSEPNDEAIERRESLRLDMEKELVNVIWQDEQGNELSTKCICVDISRQGMQLNFDREIKEGSEIFVQFSTNDVNAKKWPVKVLRCHLSINGWYLLGLQMIRSES